jgi:hypothetical protein
MKKMQEFENLDASSISNSDTNTQSSSKKELKLLDGHKTLNIPNIQLSLVNKSMYRNGGKQFMMIAISDVFL